MINNKLDSYVIFFASEECNQCNIYKPHVARAAEILDVDYHIIEGGDPQFEDFVEALDIEVIPSVVYCNGDGDGIETYEGGKEIDNWLEGIY